jgi:hypothetical protein
MLAQGIGGETQRTRTPSIASRHSHSLEDDDDEGEATIVFTAVDLHGKKNSRSKRLFAHKSEFSFLVLPMDALFSPCSTIAAGGINSLTASQEGRCSLLTTVNRSGQCSQSSSKTLHLNSCFNFCNGFFPHSSLPPHPLHPSSIPRTNSCK